MIATIIDAITPLKTDSSEVLTNRPSPRIIPSEKPRMGDISGATSIAPMTTAGLLSSNPRVAMIEDKTISTK